MGKSFTTELQELETVYDWAQTAHIESLTAAIIELKDYPILAVGSGGSLTVAHFMTKLHEEFTGQISKHLTPMELASSKMYHRANVVLITARGDNKDIIDTCRRLVEQEPRSLIILCGVQNSAISRIARRFKWTQVIDYALPSGKDGFLATNSLLAFTLLLTRAYSEVFQANLNLPTRVPREWVSIDSSRTIEEQEIAPILRVLQRSTISILYEGWGHSAAIDLESKFTEAALANVQIADYRNFAHGRHYWLAKRATDTSVIAFVTPEGQDVAEKTLRLLPRDIPVVRISTQYPGSVGTISLLISVLGLTGVAGDVTNIDPGRPGVPQFGRKIYHIGLNNYFSNRTKALPPTSQYEIFLQRKLGSLQHFPVYGPLRSSVENALTDYLRRISKRRFSAVVCDYDGTLCSAAERFVAPSEDIVVECIRLLQSGILLGIATGRGKSVREALRNCLPKGLWSRVIIGYYNGGDIAHLNEEAPNPDKSVDVEIQAFYQRVSEHGFLSQIARTELRSLQVTIEPRQSFSVDLVHAAVLELLRHFNQEQLRVLCSGHSVDVLAPGVSKRQVVDAVRGQIQASSNHGDVLCIGDKGAWYGNDFDLLSEEHTLSVDECPLNLNTGWNISPPGHKGVQATLDYLRALVIEYGQARLDLTKLRIQIL